MAGQGAVPHLGDHRLASVEAVAELLQKSEHGIRSVFLLKMADSDQQRHAMIKDLTINPISRKMTHIDFVRVLMDAKIRISVPIETVGIWPSRARR